jgi:hypothetical protein
VRTRSAGRTPADGFGSPHALSPRAIAFGKERHGRARPGHPRQRRNSAENLASAASNGRRGWPGQARPKKTICDCPTLSPERVPAAH